MAAKPGVIPSAIAQHSMGTVLAFTRVMCRLGTANLYQGVWNAYLARTGESLTAIRASLSRAAASAGEAETKPLADKSRTLVGKLSDSQLPSAERKAEKGLSKTRALPEPSESIQASNIKTSDLSTNKPNLTSDRTVQKNVKTNSVEREKRQSIQTYGAIPVRSG